MVNWTSLYWRICRLSCHDNECYNLLIAEGSTPDAEVHPSGNIRHDEVPVHSPIDTITGLSIVLPELCQVFLNQELIPYGGGSRISVWRQVERRRRGMGLVPLPRNFFFNFWVSKCVFWCIF